MAKRIVLLEFVLIGALLIAGCESSAGKGAAIGSLGGAGLGAIVGHQSGRTTEGALIGGAVGAGAGYVVGAEQDKKKAQAQQSQIQAQNQAAIQDANTFYVNITNSNGSVTPVKIVKQGTVYIGPKGEQYSKLPTEQELKPVYGF
jgi:outer membrane lipoprotein SlyB